MVSVDVSIIFRCRASDQDQSLILCCTNKKLDKPLGFQSKSAEYFMEEKVTSRKNPHRITACVSETTDMKDMSTQTYISNSTVPSS